MIESSNEALKAAVPEALIAGFQEVCASEETMQDVLDRPGIHRKEIQKILKETLGRDVDDNVENVDAESLPPEERRRAVASVLQTYPDIALHVLESLESRIKQFDDLMLSLERRISIAVNKKILLTEKQRKILGADSIRKLELMVKTLEKIPTERLNAVIGELQTVSAGDLQERDIAAKLDLPSANTSAEKEAQETLLGFFLETKGSFHRRWKFGASQFFQRKILARTGTREHRKNIASAWDSTGARSANTWTHLTELATRASDECEKTAGAISGRILGNEPDLTLEQKNLRLLKHEGYGSIALEDALDEYLEPIQRLGLGKSTSKGRVKTNRPEFLPYAKVALAILDDRMPGGAADLGALLAQKKKEQQDIEAWAHATAKKLRRLHQLPDGRKKQAIVKFLKANGKDWSLITKLHDFFDPYAFHYDDPAQREQYLKSTSRATDLLSNRPRVCACEPRGF